MKSQLLLVLAVAALVPSLSEGRVYSKCELKTIFQTAITLPGKYQKYKQELLAAIICQLNATSGLSSNLVTVQGIRVSSTTAQPPAFAPTGNPIGPVNQTTNPTTNTTETINPPTNTTGTTIAPTTATAADVTTAGLASPSSSTQSGIIRRKRSPSRKSEKKGKSSDESAFLFDVKWECDMEIQEDDNDMRKQRGSSDSSEEYQETTDWSLGKYGIFQLTDSLFCDSGYRQSRNVCRTDCSAFTDDDISDDIQCVLDSSYLECFMKLIPRFCWAQAKTYFSDCS